MSEDSNEGGVPRWAEDFPVSWERDHYVTRRELAKFLTLGSGLLAAASTVIALLGKLRHVTPLPRQRIGLASAIPANGSRLFRYPTAQDPCILLRLPDGTLAAYSQICTHLTCAVVHRPAEGVLFCPCHEGRFECRGGRPVAGPPERPLPRVQLQIAGDEIFAVGIEV